MLESENSTSGYSSTSMDSSLFGNEMLPRCPGFVPSLEIETGTLGVVNETCRVIPFEKTTAEKLSDPRLNLPTGNLSIYTYAPTEPEKLIAKYHLLPSELSLQQQFHHGMEEIPGSTKLMNGERSLNQTIPQKMHKLDAKVIKVKQNSATILKLKNERKTKRRKMGILVKSTKEKTKKKNISFASTVSSCTSMEVSPATTPPPPNLAPEPPQPQQQDNSLSSPPPPPPTSLPPQLSLQTHIPESNTLPILNSPNAYFPPPSLHLPFPHPLTFSMQLPIASVSPFTFAPIPVPPPFPIHQSSFLEQQIDASNNRFSSPVLKQSPIIIPPPPPPPPITLAHKTERNSNKRSKGSTSSTEATTDDTLVSQQLKAVLFSFFPKIFRHTIGRAYLEQEIILFVRMDFLA